MAEANSSIPGFYGKVPTRGDFVHRRISRSFLDPWDQWLQRSIVISKEQLDEDWLDIYLTSPIWRFALSPGICGELASTGVLMPSVDSVNRHYPMTITTHLSGDCNLLDLAAKEQDWFSRAEDAALYCLEDDFSLDELERILGKVGPSCVGPVSEAARPRPLITESKEGSGWSIEPDSLGRLCSDVYPGLLDSLLRSRFNAYSLWWTSGSDRVEPSLFVYEGLPPEGDFSTFLRGTEG